MQVRVKEGTAYWTGLFTCGLGWLCAVCSAKIAMRRAGEVGQVLEAHHARGLHAVFATLTIAHGRGDDLVDTVPLVVGSWKAMMSSRAFRAWAKRWGVLGWVRTVEVTPGGTSGSGHPHIHAIFCLDRGELSLDERFAAWRDLARAWHDVVARRSVSHAPRPEPGLGGTNLRPVWPGDEAGLANYVAKVSGDWDAAMEMTGADLKESRGEGPATYFDVGVAANRGDRQAFARWRDYELATSGVRKMTWSNARGGLRRLYGLGEERSDEELAEEVVDGELVVELDDGDAALVVRAGWRLQIVVLEAAEDDGAEGVYEVLASLRAFYERERVGMARPDG